MSATNVNNQFSFTRFKFVLKRYVALNQRTWLIGFLCVAGFLLAIAVLPTISNMFSVDRPGFTAVRGITLSLYTLGGLILTSMIFNEVHSSTKAFQFLTLPSTTFEKLSAAWFSGTIVYTFVSIISVVVLSVVIELVKGINTGHWTPFNVFNPFSADVLSTVLGFFFYQSIFLLGAVYFKKNNFIKTLLVIILFVLGTLFFLNIGLLIFGLSQNQDFFVNIQLDAQQWITPLKYIIGIGLTLFFLWLSYLKLKNKQVA
ncbi:hypothetical protein [Rhodohalobacter sulfatireducens]|uniref:ABC transporter permease n=1 Tax=Rhodohalobacter sulfatireducens TaxID=2911366 RepID=A0ABS9KAW1_9BACT|nr:hypothetical protein [Rhodohalobacter sulfatireducens]MCG2587970.1 hypothetical protein [Rhodohalobacter sulfatireducens]